MAAHTTDPAPGLLDQARPVWPLAVFVVVSAAYVVVDALDVGVVATVLKACIAASLLVWVLLASEGRPPRLLIAGLLFALLGDVLLNLPGDIAFLAGMGAFLVMQLCYIAGFLRLGAREWFAARRWAIAGWLGLWVVLNVVLGPLLGELRWPITVYSLALVAMAACAVATGSRLVGVGGLLFLVSDLLIGLRAAGIELPASGVLVMGTYCAAQLAIAVGWVLLARTAQRPVDAAPAPAA